MKRQYLGDSKDSFKWDYHHFLVPAIGVCRLQVVWMMTHDDHKREGETPPERFPATPEILEFCRLLRRTREPALVCRLPAMTGAPYTVDLHRSNQYLEKENRQSYFSDIDGNADQVVFLDPDNGFQPEHRFTEKHVLYSDIERIVKTVSPSSVVTVFQHFRRKNFPDDFARIRQRLHSGYSAAVFWHSLMFVSVTSSRETIKRFAAPIENMRDIAP